MRRAERLMTEGVAALVACVAVAAAGAPMSRPAGKEAIARGGERAGAAFTVMRLTGSRVVRCRSEWHKIQIKSAVTGKLFLLGDEARKLLPASWPPQPNGKPWHVPDALTASLGQRLFEAMKLQPEDPEGMARWLGSGQRPDVRDSLKAGGRLEAALLRQEKVEGAKRLIVRVTGTITLHHRSALASRYGPNWHKADWTLRVAGELAFDPKTRRLLGGRLTLDGDVAGAYTGQNANMQEPYTEKVALALTLDAPPSKQALARAFALIEQLGDDSYRRREAASAALLKIGPAAVGPLRAALTSPDPEVQCRAREILEKLGQIDKSPRPKPPAKPIIPLRPGQGSTW
jgi:hypothetical protein